MRILVVSDTHIEKKSDRLPDIIRKEAGKSDCCLHCGDFVINEVFETLSSLTKVYGVCGNMDNDDIREKFPPKQIIKLEKIYLGLIHGRGNPGNLIYYIEQEFSADMDKIDIFVFGHSHLPLNDKIHNKIYFNPGSATDRISSSQRTYGILEINGRNIKGRIEEIG